jgi:hypothetical protein
MFAVSVPWSSNSPVGFIFASTNAGVSWTQTSAPGNQWQAVACSADGSKVVAVTYLYDSYGTNNASMYLSTNSGATWTASSAPYEYWYAVASSADGSKLMALESGGFGAQATWSSTDSGATWTSNSILALSPISAITVSGGGNRAIAIGGDVYAWQTPPPLSLGMSSNLVNFSWPSSAPGFSLQQSFDLTSTNWTTITNTAIISGYSNQVAISPPAPSGGKVFYRLVSP